MTRPLEFLAGRATQDPIFLGHALALYAASEEITDDVLARRLGCPEQRLVMLRLCLRPRPEPEWFWSDVQEIASATTTSADTIAEVVRRADAIMALRERVLPGTMLMAARDREDASTKDERL